MIKRLALLLMVFFFSCQNEKQFTLPEPEDIDAVMATVLFDDSLGVASNNNTAKVMSNLNRLEIINWNQKSKIPPRVENNAVLMQDLIGYKAIPVDFFFQKSDSTAIVQQNKVLKTYKIKPKTLKTLRFIEMPAKDEKYTEQSFYYFTIPVFSSDKTKAYTKMTLSCPGLCGSGHEVFLEKKNGRWVIVKRKMNWTS